MAPSRLNLVEAPDITRAGKLWRFDSLGGVWFDGPDLPQRRSSSYVRLTTSSPVHRYRRPRRTPAITWLGLSSLLIILLLGTAGVASRAGTSAVRNAQAATHPAPHLTTSATPRPRPTPLHAASISDPLASARAASWSYRWLDSHPPPSTLHVRALAAILVDPATQVVLYSRQPHLRAPMASTAKLMTAMVALDSAGPDAVITVPDTAAQMPPTVMGLSVGEKVTVTEALYGMLLDSGNDAAEALAATILGREGFIEAMNEKAQALGLSDTHFANPSGIDEYAEYSSANDMALIGAYLHDYYPLLNQIVATRNTMIYANADHKAFTPSNFNELLGTYKGAIGFKTGLTDGAGSCVVSGATRGSRTLIAVVLNDRFAFTDSRALLDYGFSRPE
jgi:D-alanyl-D-alanine carboxypeptidase